MWTRQALLNKFEGILKLSFRQSAAILLGAAALTALLMTLEFNLLEANLYDLRMTRGFQTKPDPSIVIVTLDDSTTQALDEFSPLPLDLHAQFLEALEKIQPRAVGYLIDLNQVNQTNPALIDSNWSQRFVEAAHRMETHGSPVMLGTPYDVTGEVVPPHPLNQIPHAIAVIHKDGNVFAEDKITRRALTYLNDKPAFHIELAQRLGMTGSAFQPTGSFHVQEVDGDYFFFRFHGNTILNHSRPQNLPYHRVSFLDVIKGRVSAEALRGKVVLVGTLSKNDSSDFAATPYSKNAFANPKLIVHANILDSIFHNDGIMCAPPWANWLVTFIITSIVLWWVLTSTPLHGVFASLGLILFVLVTGQLLFQLKGIWVRESQPLIGIFLGYYLVVPYRLIREYKKRWDYQKKNEILTQVEEMKTNFMYLVTHDLKTPVARIQGLAEVLLRKAKDRLMDRDKETLNSIVQATDELNHFISSILELSAVESNRVQLHFESKDINQLIERSVEAFKAPARARQIQLRMTLEPLFPVKIDASLISKVINNLIDNALKYSPAGSHVSIESREVDEWIEISVRDQGIGMSEEERQNLFTRFYRAKNDTTTKITGTGLGLYLTKYFIEAHAGHVEVQSEKDRGSTFKIFLPIASTAVVQKPGLPLRLVQAEAELVQK